MQHIRYQRDGNSYIPFQPSTCSNNMARLIILNDSLANTDNNDNQQLLNVISPVMMMTTKTAAPTMRMVLVLASYNATQQFRSPPYLLNYRSSFLTASRRHGYCSQNGNESLYSTAPNLPESPDPEDQGFSRSRKP
jgi:hypothetical protein